jgi:hypothetical protein
MVVLLLCEVNQILAGMHSVLPPNGRLEGDYVLSAMWRPTEMVMCDRHEGDNSTGSHHLHGRGLTRRARFTRGHLKF